jgi:hypothetical protein
MKEDQAVKQEKAVSRRDVVRRIAMAGTVPAVVAVIAATSTTKVHAAPAQGSFAP